MGFRVDTREGWWVHAHRADPAACRRPQHPRRARRHQALAGLVLGLSLTLPVGLNAATAATSGVTFTVTSTADAVDSSPGNGICRTSAGVCTLRAAVQETNALAGADTIVVPSGTYELAIPPLNQNLADVGDLDITDSLTVSGAGAGASVVDGGTPTPGGPPRVRGLDRLFEVLADEGEVAFSGITFSDGYAAEYGGALMNNSTATVMVTASALTGNVADKAGGGIDNHLDGAVHVRNSTLANNVSFESGSALNNQRGGLLTVEQSTITSNSAADIGLDESVLGAGAVANNAELDARGTIAVAGSSISDNTAGGSRTGAAISNDGAGVVTVDHTVFTKNRSELAGGAIFNGTGEVTVTASTFTENAGESGGAIFSGAKDGRLTVSDSSFTMNSAAARGGAIANGGTGHLTVEDSTFTKNSAEGWGGAIVNDDKGGVDILRSTFDENEGLNGGGFGNEGDGLVTVEDSTFTKNAAIVTSVLASGEGGGMQSNSSGEVVITGGEFVANRARDGGGLGNEGGGQLQVTGTRFEGNQAEEKGGGILIQSGTVRMVGIDVVGNVADAAIEAGGGIAYEGDKLVSVGEAAAIEASRITGNKAKGQGGGIDSRGDGPLDILTTTISGNTAGMGGGVHHVGDAPLDVTRSTVAGNFAENGGGIFTDGDGETIVTNATVSGNRAGQFGGGLLVSSRLVIRNSTVASNTAAFGGGINNGGGDFVGDGTIYLANTIVAYSPTGGNCAGTMTSRGGNVESGNTCQFSELSDQPGTDPRLGPLADNGGPTLTHALLGGSPAHNRAACTEPDPCPPVDQRGVARPAGGGSDSGSYESSEQGSGGGDQACTGRSERPVPADYDSWVSEGTPASNFGGDSILKVKSLSSGNQRALVHFTLPAIPPGCNLVGATLRLWSSSATDGRTLEALRAGSDWTEAGVSWGNQPGTAGTPAAVQSGIGTLEWNVLAQTSDMYEHGDHGFLIRDAVEGQIGEQSLHASEKGQDNAPVLVLVFDDPSAPPVGDECPSTTQSLFADRDAWVSQGSPSNNFGTDSTLKVKSQAGYNARALIRFPLPALPAKCTGIDSAVLRVEAASATDGRTLEARRVGADWSELGVTWTNQPETAGPAVSTPSFDGPLEWGVTDLVVDMYLSESNGFQIRDSADDGVGEEQTLNGRLKLNDGPPELVVTFDDSTPETFVAPGPDSPTDSLEATLSFSSDREDARFECSLDDAPFSPCTSPRTVGPLAEGGHRFEVRATRSVRAVDPTPAVRVWTVAVPPVTTLSGPASPSGDTSATLSFSADDEEATFECSLDDAPFASCTSPVGLSELADGVHVFRVRATDAQGNVEPVPASHTWTVADPPETTIDAAPAELSRTSSPEFAFSADETGSTFECRLDDGAWLGCASPQRYLGLADGGHTFRVRATDPAGNTDAVPASHAWTIDTAAPMAAIDSGPSPLGNDSTPSFAFSSELGATFECSLGGAFAGCGSPYDVTAPLPDGSYVFEVRATDAAGNTGAPASLAFTVDTAAPVVMLDGPSGLTNDATPTFEFASEAGAAFECTLGATSGPCESPYVVVEPLADGDHTFGVQATDKAGNAGETASLAFTVDTLGPTVSLTGPSSPTNDAAPTFEFDSEEGATFACALDGDTLAGCGSPYVVSAPLADGDHAFEVQATDAAGNAGEVATLAFAIDTQAPSVTIDSGPSGLTGDSTPSFAFSSEEGATFACSLGDAFAACESPYDVTAPLADGLYTFEIRATDAAGNSGAVASLSFEVDTLGPTVTLAGPNGLTNDAAPVFTFTSENGAAFDCAQGAVFTACVSPYEIVEPLADGSYTFEVRATDAAGNAGEVASLAYTVDTVGAEVTIDSGPNGLTNDSTPSFAFSSEEGASLECALEAGFAACESPYQVADALADGAYTFEVRASDEAGNAGETASLAFTVDTQGPAATIGGGPSGVTDDATPTFSFSSEGGASFACALDSAFAPCASPYEVTTPLADGPHTFRVKATDAAGNEGVVASREFTVDAQGPATSLSGPSGLTNDATPTFTFTSEAGATFACSLDGPPAACASPYEATVPLADGAHTFGVVATDAVGNTGAAANLTFTVDTTSPAISLTGPEPETSETTARLTFAADEAVSGFRCALDAATTAACESPVDLGGLGLGQHSFRVEATDAAGNTGTRTHNWTVVSPPDTTAPETTVDSGPSGLTADSTPTFSFSSEAGAGFECRVDTAAFATCASPLTTSALGDGPHTFEVRARDGAGNADPSPASRSFTVDTAAPTIELSGPPVETSETTARFTFFAGEAVTGFRCELDGGARAACTSPVDLSGLASGPHSFLVVATDTAGNTGSATHVWRIVETPATDTTPPVVTLSGPQSGTQSTSVTFTFSATETVTWACDLDSRSFSGCPTSSPVTYNGLQPGSHEFRVRATDAAGNQAIATWDWTIASTQPSDTTPPVVSLSGPQSGTQSTSATFTFSANETATFACALDSPSFAVCPSSSPVTYNDLQPGAHQFRVRATDTAGNQAIAAWSWTIESGGSCGAPTTTTLGANADSWLLQTSPTSNYGEDSALKVDTKASANARTVVRFSLPSIPAGCRVLGASLRLYASSYKEGRTLEAVALAGSWGERAITWQNQPATTGSAATTSSGSGYRTWSVTAQVADMGQSGVSNGFLIRDAAESRVGFEQTFNSREKSSDNPPQLIVTIG